MKQKKYTANLSGYCLSYDEGTRSFDLAVDDYDEAEQWAYTRGSCDYMYSVNYLVDNATGERYTSYTDFKRKTQ